MLEQILCEDRRRERKNLLLEEYFKTIFYLVKAENGGKKIMLLALTNNTVPDRVKRAISRAGYTRQLSRQSGTVRPRKYRRQTPIWLGGANSVRILACHSSLNTLSQCYTIVASPALPIRSAEYIGSACGSALLPLAWFWDHKLARAGPCRVPPRARN